MFSDQTIIFINVISIAFLFIMLLILVAATRMKGGGGWAALIIVTTTVPAYLGNFARDFLPDCFVLFWYVAQLNTLCMPALWFFTRTQLDKSFHLTARSLLHLIPTLISFLVSVVYLTPLTAGQIEAERIFMKEGGENLPAIINDIIVFGQFLIYYACIFWYIRKRKKELQDNFSDSDYFGIKWVPRFQMLFFVLFFIVFIAYIIYPRTDAWLIQILNSIAMAYLVYCIICHSTANYLSRLPDMPIETQYIAPATSTTMTGEQMKEICDIVTEYLQISEAYKNSDLTLSTVAFETGIHHKKISTAINGYLHKNFFELVNGMRIEEAKRLLRELSSVVYVVESIYLECGFRSRSTFFTAFKKIEGVSPAQWLRQMSSTNN